MTQTSEKSNSSRQLEMAAGEGVDIISNLPDSIIHHILSFLDTQSAVQTCVLSKQWECSWKHVHSLNLELKLDHYRLSLLGISVWKLEIVAPKLKSFRLYFEEYMRFSELILPSLVHADIQSQCWNSTSQDYDVVKQNLVTMFHGLRNVESLTLFDNMSKAVHGISKFLEQQPSPFMKLKKLKLEYWHEGEIPYKVLDSYFVNGSANDGLNIQIQKQGLWQVMIVRRP